MNPSKRAFDLFWTIPGLLVLAPVLFVIAVVIKVHDRGPVFFRQERVGHKGRRFRIFKFRTMVVDAEKRGKQLTVGRDPRVTPIGVWLRRSKLDELPQLLNVVAGEMTLVGPRPEVPYYVGRYKPHERKVLDLVPGITDPASIAFRNESDLLQGVPDPERFYVEVIMPRKIALNLQYEEGATRWKDFLVILRTLFPGLPSRPSVRPAAAPVSERRP